MIRESDDCSTVESHPSVINCILTFLIKKLHPSIYPSIHPFSTAYPGSGRGGSSLRREAQTSLTPATSSSSSGGIPRRSQTSRET
ncbi:hypothetical protein D4764_08G0001760 [Takifugu flavidus]|uniref:Uncharacterized protein n=1 Tax=Takifugu flavidus TaxID=433684 RepID=A0A5C6MN45_9TELE|nr:hypothetical protein D4764_08G0001760 [Takifugu flavidus]